MSEASFASASWNRIPIGLAKALRDMPMRQLY